MTDATAQLAPPPKAEEQRYRKRPEGPVAVAVFSACCGVFALGLASLINQGLNPLQWIPIPGVTPADQLQGGRKMVFMWSSFAQMTGLFFTMIIVWVVVWVVLHESYAHRARVGRGWYVASASLLAVGLLLSWPPFYQWVFREPFAAPLRLGQPFTGGSGMRAVPRQAAVEARVAEAAPKRMARAAAGRAGGAGSPLEDASVTEAKRLPRRMLKRMPL